MIFDSRGWKVQPGYSTLIQSVEPFTLTNDEAVSFDQDLAKPLVLNAKKRDPNCKAAALSAAFLVGPAGRFW